MTYRVLEPIRPTERGIPYQSRDSRERSARTTQRVGKLRTRGRGTETVLGMLHDRGKQGVPIHDLYRQLYNPELYLRAYTRNRGCHVDEENSSDHRRSTT